MAGENLRRVHPDGSSGEYREGFLFAGVKSSAIAGGSDDHANFAHVGISAWGDIDLIKFNLSMNEASASIAFE